MLSVIRTASRRAAGASNTPTTGAAMLHVDLGQSLRLHDSVTHLILQRYPYTLALTVAALLIGIAAAVPAGIWSALHRNRWQDRAM